MLGIADFRFVQCPLLRDPWRHVDIEYAYSRNFLMHSAHSVVPSEPPTSTVVFLS